MGIFTRFRDIISSNINAMLDKAEDPEKLIKLMIREMEDTLVEIKASCAGVMASMKKIQRQLDEVQTRITYWEERAALAVRKGRDDLAREALLEKRRYHERAEALEEELTEHNMLVEQYQEDIAQLEGKLTSAREKQRMLQQRHIHARRKMRAQEDIRRMETSDAIFRFEEFEQRIDRMEAEADLVNFGRKETLEGELDSLLVDDDIEQELERIKSSFSNKEEAPSQA
ncbi:MAG: phage shock protein PspA [Deltaproteobacteria bacterium]|nr:phage shock protein PspA [Deltaproteobacteria bacterium]